jgi:hypothetical protein
MPFSFPITSFEVVHFKKWTSLLFSVFFLIRLSLSHDLGERFIQVTHIFLEVAFLYLFFILSFKIQVFLKLSFFNVFSSIGLSYLHDTTCGFWQLYLVLLMLCFLIFFFIDFSLILSFYSLIPRVWQFFLVFFLSCRVVSFFFL